MLPSSQFAPGCPLHQRLLLQLGNWSFSDFFEACERRMHQPRVMVRSRIRCELTAYCGCNDAVACILVLGVASMARLPGTTFVDEQFIARVVFVSWLKSLNEGLKGFQKMCDDLRASIRQWDKPAQQLFCGIVVIVVLGVCIRYYNYCYQMAPTAYEMMIKDQAVLRTMKCLIHSSEAFPLIAPIVAEVPPVIEAAPVLNHLAKRPKFVESSLREDALTTALAPDFGLDDDDDDDEREYNKFIPAAASDAALQNKIGEIDLIPARYTLT